MQNGGEVHFTHGEDGLKYELCVDPQHGVMVRVEHDGKYVTWSQGCFFDGWIVTNALKPAVIEIASKLEKVVPMIRANWQGIVDEMVAGAVIQYDQDQANAIRQRLDKVTPILKKFKVIDGHEPKPEQHSEQVAVDISVDVVGDTPESAEVD